MICRWIDHGADVQNYKSSSHKHEFWPTAEMSSSLNNSNKVIEPVWALITCLKMKDANSYWKSCHEHFWSLGLCWSLGNLVANPASGTIDISTVSARKSLKSMWTETWKLPTPHKPQFLSLKRIRETHTYSLGLFYWKIIMHLKCLTYARNSINIHFFSLSFSSLMPSWISPQGIWPGEDGHIGDTGSEEPHSSRLFRKWLKVKLGQESGDVWVRDRVKLRFNLSPFHVLTRLCRAKSLKEIQCWIFSLIWWEERGMERKKMREREKQSSDG